jgi:hypothetical protein
MTDNEHEPKVLALAAHFKVSPDTISECRFGNDLYECEDEPGEYLVLTDEEADKAFHESVENYVEECILGEIPEAYRAYFDTEKYINDVRMGDGRGPTLAICDGAEEEERVDGTWYFIYRVN